MPIERAGLVQGTLEMLIHKALAPATHVQAFREQRAVASEGSRRVRPNCHHCVCDCAAFDSSGEQRLEKRSSSCLMAVQDAG